MFEEPETQNESNVMDPGGIVSPPEKVKKTRKAKSEPASVNGKRWFLTQNDGSIKSFMSQEPAVEAHITAPGSFLYEGSPLEVTFNVKKKA